MNRMAIRNKGNVTEVFQDCKYSFFYKDVLVFQCVTTYDRNGKCYYCRTEPEAMRIFDGCPGFTRAVNSVSDPVFAMVKNKTGIKRRIDFFRLVRNKRLLQVFEDYDEVIICTGEPYEVEGLFSFQPKCSEYEGTYFKLL